MQALVLEIEKVRDKFITEKIKANKDWINSMENYEEGYANGQAGAFRICTDELNKVLELATKLYQGAEPEDIPGG